MKIGLLGLAACLVACGSSGNPAVDASAMVDAANAAPDAPLAPPDGALLGSADIVIDGTGGGRVLDGIGAISGGGGNTRLLIDYPEPYRSQVLDYLFKPGYGAALQILKVEIGGDMNSTDGAEASASHTAGDENYQRGYEWWLMKQAKARNPAIHLAALCWGAPGWLGGGNFWSQDTIDYIIRWLKHARSDHGLDIEYLGGWNENGYDKAWFKLLKAALVANGLPTKVVGGDSEWSVADDMVADSAFNAAVDVVGVHYNCGGDGAPADTCDSTATARALGKPLWSSENGSQDLDSGAPAMVRAMNRGYIDAQTTAYINWPLVAALPPNLPFTTTGLLVADQPWSGHYRIGKSVWVAAHTTQFAQPGWRYIDSASGYLGGARQNGSYVSLRAPGGNDWSMIIETTRATAARPVVIEVKGGLSTAVVHVWHTNLTASDPAQDFVAGADLTPVGGKITLTLERDHIYSLTTTVGQAKGTTTIPPPAAFALPYSDDFDAHELGRQASYLADEDGSFEITACGGGRAGHCVRQMAPIPPIYWHGHAGHPYTLIGDGGWSNYVIESDVLFEQDASAELIGRFGSRDYWEIGHIDAYYFKVTSAGAWSILKNSTSGTLTTLASGDVAALGTGQWHRLRFVLQDSHLSAAIDGTLVGSASDTSYAFGPAGLAVGAGDGGWRNVQFDNLSITPGAPHPSFALRNRHSGKLLSVAGAATADGALVVQESPALGAAPGPGQTWQLIDLGAFKLIVNTASGKAFDDPAASQNPGTQLIIWSVNRGLNQQWQLTASGNYVTLTNQASHLLADVQGAASTDGAAVIQAAASGADDEDWELVPVP